MSSGPLQELNNLSSTVSDKVESDEEIIFDGEVRRTQTPHGPAALPDIVFEGVVVRTQNASANPLMQPNANAGGLPDENDELLVHAQLAVTLGVNDNLLDVTNNGGPVGQRRERDLQEMDLFGENEGSDSDAEGIDLDETSDSGRDYDSDEMEDATDSDLEQMIDYRSESEVSVSHAKEYLELLEDRLDRRLRRVRKRQMKKARRCDKCGSFAQGHGNNKRGGGGGGGRGRRGGRPGRALAS